MRRGKGTEREEVLLLGDDIVKPDDSSDSVCGKEDVEGNHTALRWAIWTMQRCFICAPADLSREEAERMVARARIDAE